MTTIRAPYRAVTANDQRIDREIGNNDGWVDAQEVAVADAAYDVFQMTGMNIRPHLGYDMTAGGLTMTNPADGFADVYISRAEQVDAIPWVVFHEAGHVAYRHDLSGESPQAEHDADFYAGKLIRANGGDIQAALTDIRSRVVDATHGTSEERATYLWSGYAAPPDAPTG